MSNNEEKSEKGKDGVVPVIAVAIGGPRRFLQAELPPEFSDTERDLGNLPWDNPREKMDGPHKV